MARGAFLSLDGLDGTGKSTQCRRIAEWLRGAGHEVVECIDPGGTEIGAKLREILLFGKSVQMSSRTEALLFCASRAELVEQVIRPALARGAIVISDRYLLANVVYHGHAGGLDPEGIWKIEEFGTGGILPGLTVVLDLSVEESLRRRGRDADRLESRGLAYAEKVRAGFLDEATEHEDIIVIDAAGDADAVFRSLQRHVRPWLETQGFFLER
jgi:dTMP kinase